MKYRDIIATANGNLRRSKLRTFLTISAVFMGAFTLMLTTGIGAGLKAYVAEQVGAVGAKDVVFVSAAQEESENPFGADEPKKYDPDTQQSTAVLGGAKMLQAKDIAAIEATKGIEKVVPLYSATPQYVAFNDEQFIADLDQVVEGVNQPMRTGQQVAVDADHYEVTLPPGFVKALGFKNDQAAIGKTVSFGFKDSSGVIFNLDATVVGVQEKTIINSNQPSANTALMRDAYERMTAGLPAFQTDAYQAAFARFDSNLNQEQLKALKDDLKQNGYEASTLEDQLGIINGVITGLTTFLNIFAAIALAAGSFGIVNTLLMAVQERTREIGLMKALGMSRRKIFALFSIEAALIGFWGALTAVVLANIVGRVGSAVATNTILKDFEGLQLFSFPLISTLLIMLLIVTIAVVAAVLPARRASRLDPIEALRYE
jgi:putative ABC transport system permease protein